MSYTELAVLVSRLTHFSGLIAFTLVYIFAYRQYAYSLKISRASIVPMTFLIIGFIVVLMRPTEIPGIWFVILLNTLYGSVWWLSIRSYVGKALIR